MRDDTKSLDRQIDDLIEELAQMRGEKELEEFVAALQTHPLGSPELRTLQQTEQYQRLMPKVLANLTPTERALYERVNAPDYKPPTMPTGAEGDRSMITIGAQERTYRPDAEAQGRPTFLHDLFRAQVLNDPEASARLERHGHEVKVENPAAYERAVSTGGVGAFVPPEYMADAFAEYLRAGRPVANLVTAMPLPEEGMSVNLPRITTGSSTAVQNGENTSTSNTDIDETTLSVPVRTVTGYTDISRQALDRGVLVEQVAFADLAADYASKLDVQVINGSGSDGQHLGILNTGSINAVTYTDASPTVAELWPKLANALGLIISTRFTGPTHIVLNPNTWAWMLASLGTDNRPLINAGASGPHNALGISTEPNYNSTVGSLLGIPVVLDANIPTNLGAGTNETRIIVADLRDSILMEDAGGAPVQVRYDSVGSSTLTARLQVYGYSAFTAGRQPKAVSVIAGTGLITPAL